MEIDVLRGRLAQIGVTQHDLADRLGINSTLLNHILKGRRDAPPDFEKRVNEVLAKMEAAEKAANKAREKVLSGGKAR